jgi:hypothetical protein
MERWLDKVLNSSHPVISPRNVDHGNIKKIKISKKNVKKNRINQRKGRKNKLVTKAKVRVDKNPLVSYI